jgi:dihydrofolate reductase
MSGAVERVRRPPVIAIAAIDEDGGLARGGELPWHAPSDLKRFSRLTTGDGRNAVVMGRLTWDSLEPRYRPLPRRLNLVLTRQPWEVEGAVTVHTLEDAVTAASGAETLWVCGGAQVYALGFARGLVDAVELTRISGRYGCDLFFPPIPDDFVCVSSATRTDGALTITDERWERGAR